MNANISHCPLLHADLKLTLRLLLLLSTIVYSDSLSVWLLKHQTSTVRIIDLSRNYEVALPTKSRELKSLASGTESIGTTFCIRQYLNLIRFCEGNWSQN